MSEKEDWPEAIEERYLKCPEFVISYDACKGDLETHKKSYWYPFLCFTRGYMAAQNKTFLKWAKANLG